MKRLLFVKMLRDMRKSVVTYLLCVLIVAVGFCGYSVLELSSRNLTEAKNAFFRQTSFSDGFAQVEKAPLTAAFALQNIDGIRTVQGRLEENIRIAGFGEEVQLLLVSIEDGGMNLPLLSRGGYPQAGKRELIVGDAIAEARGLKPGDSMELMIAGKRVPVEICGAGITPENIYMVKDMGDMFPDPSVYDAGFMDYQVMGQLLGKTGYVNRFLIDLEPGTAWKDVEEPVKEALKPYGCYRVYENKDQISVSMLEAELEQLGKMSGVVPFLFLVVAAVILYITLSRLVEQQRGQIGTLLAMGIPVRKIQFHYMLYGAFTGFLGGFLGGAGGYAFAGPMADFYRMYFKLPKATAPVSYGYLIGGTVAAVLFCGATAFLVTGSVGRLSPASALRPAAPKTARISWLERLPGFRELFTVTGLMAVRSLSRNRRRTMLSLMGIAFAYMITASLVSMISLFDVFIFDYWEKTQRQDIMVQFNNPVKASDALEAVRGPDVSEAEGVVSFPVTLKGPSGSLDCTIEGIASDSGLCRLYREDGNRINTDSEGIVISRLMANVLGAETGDTIEVEVAYPSEKTSRVPVTGVAAQYMGSTAYMSHEGAGRISMYRDVYTSVLLKAPAHVQQEIAGRLSETSAVSLVESRLGRLEKYRTMMGSMNSIMMSMCMMGVLIGFVVVYVSSVISFEELKRELSILMSLGLGSRQCLEVISVSQYILAAGGILAGIPMTMWVSRMMSVTMSSDLYAIPDFVDMSSLMISVGLTVLAVWFSSRVMLRRIRKMSPVELLRDRE